MRCLGHSHGVCVIDTSVARDKENKRGKRGISSIILCLSR